MCLLRNLLSLSSLKKPFLGMHGSQRSLNLSPENKGVILSGDIPDAYNDATIDPALTPARISGRMPNSSNALSAPACANPRAPPPLRAIPILYCLFDWLCIFLFYVTNLV